MLSILHRITGAGLAFGAVVLAWWLFAALAGEHAFSVLRDVKESWFGQFVLLGLLFSLVYHFLNGLRHLKWDMVIGFNIKTVYLTGYIVLTASVILTALIWTMGGG